MSNRPKQKLRKEIEGRNAALLSNIREKAALTRQHKSFKATEKYNNIKY